MTRVAGGRPVAVRGPLVPERLLEAVTEQTRAVVVCNPNDPTGEWLDPAALEELGRALPQRAWLILDEALVDFAGPEAGRKTLGLLDEIPRLLVVRTLSKAYGLAGLRCGWALGPAGAAEALAGVRARRRAVDARAGRRARGPAQVRAAHHAARRPGGAGAGAPGGRRGLDALRRPPEPANALWLRLPGVSGPALAARLLDAGIRVAAGGAWATTTTCASRSSRRPRRTGRCGRSSGAGLSAASPLVPTTGAAASTVVCSRILRQARVRSRSAPKCLTTLRTRVAEISMPWRSQISWKRS